METSTTPRPATPSALDVPRGEPHVEFRDVHVAYGRDVTALAGVSLSIYPGEFVFLTGETGSGKSTLLRLITQQIRATRGQVFHKGIDVARYSSFGIHRLRRAMGIVTQDFALLPNKTVWENVAYAMRAVGHDAKEVRRRVPIILDQVNMGHRADAMPGKISGGEQQRVAIGRALINHPPLLLADEPTGNLDPGHSWGIIELLLRLNAEGVTVIVVTHDMSVVERAAQRIIHLHKGKVVEDIPPVIKEASP